MDYLDIIVTILLASMQYFALRYSYKKSRREYCEFWGITEEQLDLELDLLNEIHKTKIAAQKYNKSLKKLIKSFEKKNTKKRIHYGGNETYFGSQELRLP